MVGAGGSPAAGAPAVVAKSGASGTALLVPVGERWVGWWMVWESRRVETPQQPAEGGAQEEKGHRVVSLMRVSVTHFSVEPRAFTTRVRDRVIVNARRVRNAR